MTMLSQMPVLNYLGKKAISLNKMEKPIPFYASQNSLDTPNLSPYSPQ
jgi:hypothetical protein